MIIGTNYFSDSTRETELHIYLQITIRTPNHNRGNLRPYPLHSHSNFKKTRTPAFDVHRRLHCHQKDRSEFGISRSQAAVNNGNFQEIRILPSSFIRRNYSATNRLSVWPNNFNQTANKKLNQIYSFEN
jgi:hypothetical protein